MKIMIEMSEERYKEIVESDKPVMICRSDVAKVLANGIVLPKGHGRILDEKDILDTENNNGGWYDLVDMPEYIAGVKAIVEADKAECEDTEDVAALSE